MPLVETIVKTTIDLDIKTAAQWFADMMDEDQAQFFIEVGKLSKDWPNLNQQWWYVGRHLRDCDCSTPEAKDIINTLHEAMQPGE